MRHGGFPPGVIGLHSALPEDFPWTTASATSTAASAAPSVRSCFRNIWEARMIGVIALMLVGALVVDHDVQLQPAAARQDRARPPRQRQRRDHHAHRARSIATRPSRSTSGGTTIIDIPGSDPVPENAAIKVEIYRKDWGPIHQVTYKFGGYDEAAKAS